jgi:CRP-like cAMP-binding protein
MIRLEHRPPFAGVDPPPPVTIDGSDPVRRRLDRLSPGLADAIGIRTRRFLARTVRSRREIAHDGEMSGGVPALRSGWAAYVRHFADGRRQIQHLFVPGDLVVLDRRMPYPATIIALTPVTLIDLDGLRVPDATLFDEALRRHAMQTLHHLLDATARLGRQSAIERFAHLLLELRDRLLDVGLASARAFPMPLTQEMLADTLGLTSVHVNRTLQVMRQEELIALAGRDVTLLRPDELMRMADYQSPPPLDMATN